MHGASFALTVVFIAGLTTSAIADTTVSIVDVQESAVARALWDRIAKDYEAEHKGVAVQFKYIEGESYKEKLPTMLQSDSRPALVYSWGGGVMDAQNQAGFLKDITAEAAPFEENLAQTAVNAFKVDGKTVGVPFDTGLVAFYYNKDLFKKAGVNAEAIKTWDDFLGAVKALKAAGITPIINGGGDKWPMHFYYSYLIMRIGGENALADAKAGKNGGFKNSIFVEAGKRLRDLAALEPFQAGYLATKYGEAAGMFGDGKGAMQLMFELLPAM
jgi:raffinose/stachyose/melibiose transport system substrate-binding protein